MSEKDLALKMTSRRLAWSQGYATRINVPLRSVVEKRPGKSNFEEYTDLDVLAVSTTLSGRVQTQLFDCKSSSNRATERIFWLRGVADFFGANDAWMVRPGPVPAATRQLAGKLHLGVLTNDDLDVLALVQKGSAAAHLTPAMERLFDPLVTKKLRESRNTLDKRLANLVEYLNYDYWVYEPHENLAQLPAHLQGAASALDGNSPLHLSLVFDCMWLFVHSLAQAADYVRRTNAAAPEKALLEYFLGGQIAIREKEVRLVGLRKLSQDANITLEPPYFRALAQTFLRMYVVPASFTRAMRYCEITVANLADNRRPYLSSAAGAEYDEVFAKLLFDVGGFLASTAQLSPSFRTAIRTITLDRRNDTAATAGIADATGTAPDAQAGNGQAVLEFDTTPADKDAAPK